MNTIFSPSKVRNLPYLPSSRHRDVEFGKVIDAFYTAKNHPWTQPVPFEELVGLCEAADIAEHNDRIANRMMITGALPGEV